MVLKSDRRLRPWHGVLIAIAIILLSLTLVVRGCAKTVVRLSVEYSESSPIEFSPPRGNDQEIDAALEKAGQLADSLPFGKNITPVSFTADELNLLIYYHPLAEKIADSFRFDIRDELLVIQGSIPLDELAEAGMDELRGRFLNAEVTLDLSVVNGALLLYIRDVKVKGEQLPESLIKSLADENFGIKIANKPEIAVLLSMLRNVYITDGKIVVAP